MILFMHCGTKYCTHRETRHGLFNAALRALLNRPVSHLAPRAVFVPNAFTTHKLFVYYLNSIRVIL